jgi:FixJ family two-component response regulator/glycine cleavage system H lipoate-binding protein
MSKAFDILAIDDEEVILASIAKLCSAENLKVDTVIDAIKGLRQLEKNSYRLIVCDIMMPEMDGFTFLKHLYEKRLEIPVIITTGFSTVENAVKSLSRGAIDFLPKPFTVEELLSVVMRGLKYAEIVTTQEMQDIDAKKITPQQIAFVSCPADYLCLGYASWAAVEQDGTVRMGVTDLFLRTVATITGIDFFNVEEEVIQGNTCAHAVTEDHMTHQVLAPLTGRIIKRNEKLGSKISIIDKDPFFEGWLYTVIPSDLDYELERLTQGIT